MSNASTRPARVVTVLFDRLTGDVINGAINGSSLPSYNTERVALAVMIDKDLVQQGAIYYFLEGEPILKVYNPSTIRRGDKSIFVCHRNFSIRNGFPAILCDPSEPHQPKPGEQPSFRPSHKNKSKEWRLFDFGNNVRDRAGFQLAFGALNNPALKPGKYWVSPDKIMSKAEAAAERSMPRCIELSHRMTPIDPDMGLPLPIQTFYLGAPTQERPIQDKNAVILPVHSVEEMLRNKFNALIRAGTNNEITELWRNAISRCRDLSQMERVEAEMGLTLVQSHVSDAVQKHIDKTWKTLGLSEAAYRPLEVSQEHIRSMIDDVLPMLSGATNGVIPFVPLGAGWENRPEKYTISMVTGSPVNIKDVRVPADFRFPKVCPIQFCE